jgi:oligopeptidase A
MNNPFYKIPYHPEFGRMTPEAAESALDTLLREAADTVDALEKSFEPTWEGLISPLHDAQRHLYDAWNLLNHLLAVMNSDGWRRVQERMQPEVIRFSQRVGQSRKFYEGCLALRERSDALLNPCRERILDKMIRAAEHAGVALAPEQQQHFNQIETELERLSTKFSNNLLDSRKAFSLTLTTREEAEGMPCDLRAITAEAARADGAQSATAEDGPWKITLDYAVYGPFMKHSRNRAAREILYRKYVTLASEGGTDNRPLIESILALKQQKAALLGYRNAAELSLSRKMAPDVASVYRLFDELAAASRPAFAREQSALLEFAGANGCSESELAPWELAFWAEREREQLYDYSEEQLSRYFQFPKVLQGMFALVERIFAIRIEEHSDEVQSWHADVRFFRVRHCDGTPLACFYLDPYSRPETKRGGAWMNEFRTRERLSDGALQLPMAVMCCNQSVPVAGRPALMRMQEVVTLFHEFGHALQHMLTEIDDPQASGINGVEWDAVEIASQFMENWCYDRKTLQAISEHVETGDALPDALFEKIVASRNFRAANAMMRQLFLGATDMDLYARFPSAGWQTPDDVKRDNAAQYMFPMVAEDRSLCSFAHIFGGGYSAGYYSYKWSEVLSADCFAAFEEAGLENDDAMRETGLRLRATLMGLGGSAPPMEVFRAFRGREPGTEALLRHCGLVGGNNAAPQ